MRGHIDMHGPGPSQLCFAAPAATSLFSQRHALPAPRPGRRRGRPVVSAKHIQVFQPSDFELRRVIGQQSFATITDWEYYVSAPLAPTRTTEASSPAVRLYDARIISSLPSLYNTRVLLKEFLPAGAQLGDAESASYNTIYQCDPELNPDTMPVATLFGEFFTDESFASLSFKLSWRRRFPKSPEPPQPDARFLVFRWEGLQTAQAICRVREDTGQQWFNRLFPGTLVKQKEQYLRKFIAESLEALIFLHTKAGLIHRSIGIASIMVNTSEWRYASSLQVKLRDLGFATSASGLLGERELERARKAGAASPGEIAAYYFSEDIYAMGYALLEIIFSVFSGTAVTQDSLKKLFEDTFSCKRDAVVQYCSEDPNWADAVNFLGQCDNGGWDLVLTMLQARDNFKIVSVSSLTKSPFLLS